MSLPSHRRLPFAIPYIPMIKGAYVFVPADNAVRSFFLLFFFSFPFSLLFFSLSFLSFFY
ncbi:hypothetical protein BDV11DRAFT_200318, partial [Aspergillus similis]